MGQWTMGQWAMGQWASSERSTPLRCPVRNAITAAAAAAFAATLPGGLFPAARATDVRRAE